MFEGFLVSINVCGEKGKDMETVDEVRAVPGQGLEGDRYFKREGTFSKKHGPDREVTLIEIEAIEGARRDYDLDLQAAAARRNLVTRGVPLNHLVDREFQVGEVTLRGIKLCEPCGHLEKLTGKPVQKALAHRGGLRAQVVTGGVIHPGDAIRPRA